MHMHLYWSADLGPVVFDWWRTNNIWMLVVSCVILAALSTTSEFVGRRAMRECPNKSRPALYAVRCSLSSFLMLALMSFNGWAIASIIIGYTIGYALFADTDEQDLLCQC